MKTSTPTHSNSNPRDFWKKTGIFQSLILAQLLSDSVGGVPNFHTVLLLSLLTRFKNMPRKRARRKHGVYHCCNDSCCVQHPESEG